MLVLATPMRERGRQRDKRDIDSAIPVSGDLLVTEQNSAQYGRRTRVASFQTSSPSDPQPLPPLHDVELSWMGPLGFVLTGIEFIGNVGYAQSWYCRAG